VSGTACLVIIFSGTEKSDRGGVNTDNGHLSGRIDPVSDPSALICHAVGKTGRGQQDVCVIAELIILLFENSGNADETSS
jgi:hypothetical protein